VKGVSNATAKVTIRIIVFVGFRWLLENSGEISIK
jgi:hypothetical protein